MNRLNCPHMDHNVLSALPATLNKLRKESQCHECDAVGPNFWICLQQNCLQIGCPENVNDHNTLHFRSNPSHAVHMNVSSQRLWCYLCEKEVWFPGNSPQSTLDTDRSYQYHHQQQQEEAIGEEFDYGTISDNRRQFGGLVGLKNLANTCYMNAALQALSNCPPLTGYFLDCGSIVDTLQMQTVQQKKSELAKGYHRLVKEMWWRNRRSNGYVVPNSILHGIRVAHPMFRGYQQHDTQEFLRCFMDQLHEELKEATPPPPSDIDLRRVRRFVNSAATNEVDDDDRASNSSSPPPSEAEYETCDSGVSEQSQLSDLEEMLEEEHQNQQRNYSRHEKGRKSQTSTSPTSTNNKDDDDPPKSHRSIISDVFDGKLLSSVQCLTCDRFSTREETFQDLSLPIPGKDHLAVLHQSQSSYNLPSLGVPLTSSVAGGDLSQQQQQQMSLSSSNAPNSSDGWFYFLWQWMRSWFWGPPVTLYDCMAAFFSADELKNDNMYSCEKCKKLRNGIKFSRVLALPEMLCVHLKRFRHDLSYSSKISSPVHFPLTGLDMRPYLHKDCRSEVSTYDLTAVICHHGTVGGGHYTCYAKHEPTGNWFEYDDQSVTKVQPETVQNCEPYVLFYRKMNPQMEQLRAQAMELVDRGPPVASDIRFFVSKSWFNRFNTFAEPGPIDNWALLCPHGGLPPCKAGNLKQLVMPLPQPLWDFLYETFGGGPACNRLFECKTCKLAAESLIQRQREELEIFAELKNEFHMQEPSTIYAISMHWFRQWQLFARGMTTDEPGPVNNTTIAAQTSDTQPIRNVRPGSDYAQIDVNLWRFFYGIYGGGPEIVLRGNPQPMVVQMQQQQQNQNQNQQQQQQSVVVNGRYSAEEEEEDHRVEQRKRAGDGNNLREENGEEDEEQQIPQEQMEVEEEEDVNLTNSNYQRMEQEKEIHQRSVVNGLREDYDDMTMKTDRSESSAAETAVIQDDQDEIVGDQPEVFRLTTKLRQHMSMADADEEDQVEEVDGQGDATKLDNYTTRSGSWVNGTSASLERKRVMAETGEGGGGVFGTLEKKDKHRTRDSSGLFGADGTFVSHSSETIEDRTTTANDLSANQNGDLIVKLVGAVPVGEEKKKSRSHHHGKGKHGGGRKGKRN